MPARPVVRRQLRHRKRVRVGHDRIDRTLHHGHRLGSGLGATDPSRPKSVSSPLVSSAPGLAVWRRLKSCAAWLSGRQSTTGMTALAGLLIYGIPSFKLEKEIVERRADLLADGGVTFNVNFEVGRDATLQESA